MPTPDLLNPREQEFIRRYVANGGNGKQAAIAAGYSPKSAKQQAHRLLTRDDLRAHLRELAAKADGPTVATLQRVQERLTEVIEGNLSEFIDEAGRFKGFGALTGNVHQAALAEVSRRPGKHGDTVTVKIRDLVPAIMALAALKGWTKSDQDNTASTLAEALKLMAKKNAEYKPPP